MLPVSPSWVGEGDADSLARFTSEFIRTLDRALRLGSSNAKKVRGFVKLIVDLPYEADFEDLKKDYPLHCFGDDYMRSIIEKPTGFKSDYAKDILYYLNVMPLESKVRSLAPGAKQKLVSDLRKLDPNVGKRSVEEWVGDTVGDLLAFSSGDESELQDARSKVALARAKHARLEYQPVLLADSQGCCSMPHCRKPLHVKTSDRSIIDAQVITINPEINNALPANLLITCHDCAITYGTSPTPEHIADAMRVRQEQQDHHQTSTVLAKRNVEEEIAELIRGLSEADQTELFRDIRQPLRIESKLPSASHRMLNAKVLYNVTAYFTFIEVQFKNNEMLRPGGFDAFSRTIADIFDQLDQAGESHDKIFTHLVDWLCEKTLGSREASEAVISYFVQNCEVFR